MGLDEQLVLVGRVALAALLGYLVGLERAYRGKDAGDRTFALLALASAAFVGLGIELFPLSADRVIQGIATGVGFLGAGIIFRAEGGVHGLTTAAAAWAAASIGALSGGGLYLPAALIAGLTLIVLELHQVEFLRRLSEPGGDSTHHD
jgi:putative Mg2+ transporter-C (MgtC) family protein